MESNVSLYRMPSKLVKPFEREKWQTNMQTDLHIRFYSISVMYTNILVL